MRNDFRSTTNDPLQPRLIYGLISAHERTESGHHCQVESLDGISQDFHETTHEGHCSRWGHKPILDCHIERHNMSLSLSRLTTGHSSSRTAARGQRRCIGLNCDSPNSSFWIVDFFVESKLFTEQYSCEILYFSLRERFYRIFFMSTRNRC